MAITMTVGDLMAVLRKYDEGVPVVAAWDSSITAIEISNCGLESVCCQIDGHSMATMVLVIDVSDHGNAAAPRDSP